VLIIVFIKRCDKWYQSIEVAKLRPLEQKNNSFRDVHRDKKSKRKREGKATSMRRTGLTPHRSLTRTRPTSFPKVNPQVWVQLGEDPRNTNATIF